MDREHHLYLLLGSNIDAEHNLASALALLGERMDIDAVSSVWQSDAVGSDGPAYLNIALEIRTIDDPASMKERFFRPIEAKLGRIRTEDKNADRTIDIDAIVLDGEVIDPQLWERAHIAVPMAEIGLSITADPYGSLDLRAKSLQMRTNITRRDDLFALLGGKIMDTPKERLDYGTAAPDAVSAFIKLEGYVIKSGLDRELLELIKMRASQINGCAYCLDMHTKDARARGESEQRLYGLSAWREAPYYTKAERAVLAWTEAVTQISDHKVTDELYDEMRRHFTEKQVVDLTWAVVAINGWNRMAIAFHKTAGTYMPDSPVAKKGN